MLEQSPQPNVLAAGGPSGLSPAFWVLLVATGLGAGVGAGLLMWLLRAVQHLAWSYSAGDFLDAVEHVGPLRRIAVLLAAGLFAGAAAWAMSQRPGGHAGEVAAAIWFHSGKMPLLRTMARSVVSIVIVGMGASLGREAAAKQTGAAIGSALASAARFAPEERRLLVACGVGAGFSAVYNVPFGGALFTLEVLLGSLELPLIGPALAASLIATWTSWLFLPDQPTLNVPAYEISTTLICWAALAGPVLGLAGVAYVRAISWADSRKPQGWHRFAAPVVVFALLGLASVRFPELLGNGKDVVQRAFLGQLDVWLLFILLLLKPLATSACLGSGAPGGLFMPTMTCGSLLGSLLGRLWTLIWPGAPPGSFAIIGAGALIATAAQAPISAIVIIFELTGGVNALMVPLMLAVAGAVVVARRLEARSIYSGRIHAGRSAARAATNEGARHFDRIVFHPHALVSTAARYTETLQQLMQATDRGRPLYAVDERGKIAGLIPRRLARARPLSAAQRAVVTAGDFAETIGSLGADLDEAEALRRRHAADAGALPAPEGKTERGAGSAGAQPGAREPPSGEDGRGGDSSA